MFDLITNQNEGEMWVFTLCCVAGDDNLITNQNEGEMWQNGVYFMWVAGDGDLITNQNEGKMWVFMLCGRR